MANCQHCGAAVPPDAGRCVSCGTPVTSAQGTSVTNHGNRADGTVTGPGSRTSRGGGKGDTQTRPRGTGDSTPHAGQENRASGRGSPQRERGSTGRGMPPSTGIKLIAGLVGLLGLSQVLFGFMTITSGGTVSRYGSGRAGGALVLIGLLTLAVGVAAVVVAYGLWTVRPWGWKAAAVLLAIGAAISVILALKAGSVGALVMTLAWNLGPLWYLWSVKGRYRSLSRRRHGHLAGVR